MLGPSFIKAGQVLASRPDIVREDYMEELCTLQDDVPSFPDALVRRRCLGCAHYDYRPLNPEAQALGPPACLPSHAYGSLCAGLGWCCSCMLGGSMAVCGCTRAPCSRRSLQSKLGRYSIVVNSVVVKKHVGF